MLRDPLRCLVFSARAMLSTLSPRMFCLQYFPLVHNDLVLHSLIGTSNNRLEVLFLFNDRRKFSLASLSFENLCFWASPVVFL